jgi:TIR domain
MPTKIFLCWSGTRSRRFAEAIKAWLVQVLGDSVEPSMSTQIEKGTEWFEELRNALDNAHCGILCLTPEAIGSPWIHFEAGLLVQALSQTRDPAAESARERRVFPLLYGIKEGALAGPLSAYQSTSVTDFDDVFKLLEVILQFIPQPDRLAAQQLRKNFRDRWKILQTDLEAIPRVSLNEVMVDFEDLFRRKTFRESMNDCLSQNWLDRYNGARDTQMKLRSHHDTVRKACRPFVADVFDELVAALDAYSMGLSKLVGKPESPIDSETGTVRFDNPGIAIACERQRKKIHSLVSRVVDERQAPILDEAFRFEMAETFEEKKRLIHRKSAELEIKRDDPVELDSACANSDWDFDRILYYQWREERHDDLKLRAEMDRTRLELEKVNAKSQGLSLMPLHYSLGPVEKALSLDNAVSDAELKELTELANGIRAFIERTHTDAGGQVRNSLSRIERLAVRKSDG